MAPKYSNARCHKIKLNSYRISKLFKIVIAPCSQIIIGGWKNTKSVIGRNNKLPYKTEALTPQILSGDEYRGFWIRWDCGLVEVGKEGEVRPFLKWKDPKPIDFRYYGISTGWGATGSWLTEGE